jgi:hypothetical protein
MNQQNSNEAWAKLARVAAKATVQLSEPPFGFSTRVISQWKSQTEERAWTLVEWFTWRGLAIAMLVLVGCAGLNYEAFFSPTETLADGEPLISFLEP